MNHQKTKKRNATTKLDDAKRHFRNLVKKKISSINFMNMNLMKKVYILKKKLDSWNQGKWR